MKTISKLPTQLRAVPSDRYATRCPVYVHQSVIKRGEIPGEKRLERQTGLRVVSVAGSKFKQLAKGAK